MEGSHHNARIYSGSANKDTFLVPTPLPEYRSREFFFTMSTSSLKAEKTVTQRCLFLYRHKAKCRVLMLARTKLTTHHYSSRHTTYLHDTPLSFTTRRSFTTHHLSSSRHTTSSSTQHTTNHILYVIPRSTSNYNYTTIQ